MPTTTPARRRMSAEQRRRVILDAALELFAERGYDGTSMSDVASAAGVTKPALYDHFDSKRDLYVELLDDETDLILQQIRAAADTTPEITPHAVLDAFLQVASERPFTRLFLDVAPAGDPEIVAAQRRGEIRVAQTLATFVRSLLPGLSSTEVAMAAAIGVAGGRALARWSDEHPETSRPDVVDAGVRVLWHGLSSYSSPTPESRGRR